MEDETVSTRPARRFVRRIKSFGICASCGARVEGDRCEACGKPYLQPDSRWRINLQRFSIGLVVGALLVLGGQILHAWIASASPSLAGLHVGDSSAHVLQILGSPARTPREIYWNDATGQTHRLGFWQYGLMKDPDPAVADLTVTLLDGRVYQVGVLSNRYSTGEGLRVGDRRSKANQLYGTAIEEHPIAGLIPVKYLQDGVVIKIILMPGNDHVLAIGIESPKSLPTVAEGSSPSPTVGI